jgi:hypothetical protein
LEKMMIEMKLYAAVLGSNDPCPVDDYEEVAERRRATERGRERFRQVIEADHAWLKREMLMLSGMG